MFTKRRVFVSSLSLRILFGHVFTFMMFCVMLDCIQKLIINCLKGIWNRQEDICLSGIWWWVGRVFRHKWGPIWVVVDSALVPSSLCQSILATVTIPCRRWHFLALPLLCCGEHSVMLEKTSVPTCDSNRKSYPRGGKLTFSRCLGGGKFDSGLPWKCQIPLGLPAPGPWGLTLIAALSTFKRTVLQWF